MSAKTMTCQTCARTKAWPDAFPDRAYATCWQCSWDRHVRDHHPRLVRKVVRDVKRRARRNAERDYMKAATDRELSIITGLGNKP